MIRTVQQSTIRLCRRCGGCAPAQASWLLVTAAAMPLAACNLKPFLPHSVTSYLQPALSWTSVRRRMARHPLHGARPTCSSSRRWQRRTEAAPQRSFAACCWLHWSASGLWWSFPAAGLAFAPWLYSRHGACFSRRCGACSVAHPFATDSLRAETDTPVVAYPTLAASRPRCPANPSNPRAPPLVNFAAARRDAAWPAGARAG